MKKQTTKNPQINTEELQKIQKQNPKNIIAVTKGLPFEAIEQSLKNGITNIGENRVQEAENKIKNKKIKNKIKLHLIGHLQRNKAKKAVSLFDVIQTVDSVKILKKINKEAQKIKKTQKIYIQINIGEDEKKHGLKQKEIKKICNEIKKQTNVELIGVMVILPQKLTKTKNKQLFNKTKNIQKKIKNKYCSTCTETSMGMSEDYKEAIKEGATHIRIGTKLFKKNK